MYTNYRICSLFIVLLFLSCKEKVRLDDSYNGIPIEVRETNFKQNVPFVNYRSYLESVASTDDLEDFITIEYNSRALTVKSNEDPVRFGPDWLSSSELIKVHHLANGGVAFMGYNNRFMGLQEDKTIRFSEYNISKNTIFKLVPVGNDQFAILAPNNRYICVEGFKDISANREKIGGWETFTISKLLPPQ